MRESSIVRFFGLILFVFVINRVADALDIPQGVQWAIVVVLLIITAIDYYWLGGKLNGGKSYYGKK